jgi:hypothetical protein
MKKAKGKGQKAKIKNCPGDPPFFPFCLLTFDLCLLIFAFCLLIFYHLSPIASRLSLLDDDLPPRTGIEYWVFGCPTPNT